MFRPTPRLVMRASLDPPVVEPAPDALTTGLREAPAAPAAPAATSNLDFAARKSRLFFMASPTTASSPASLKERSQPSGTVPFSAALDHAPGTTTLGSASLSTAARSGSGLLAHDASVPHTSTSVNAARIPSTRLSDRIAVLPPVVVAHTPAPVPVAGPITE